MKTYQDYLKVKDNPEKKMQFARDLISEHKRSDAFLNAEIAQDYYERRNTTITAYQKLLYDVSGKANIDNFSANFKMPSGFFRRFVMQEVQYLLSNGATFDNPEDKDRLGKKFDTMLQKAATIACVQGVSFVFWNYDHIEVFKLTEFAPLYDEEDGALKAGVKFWQIDKNKPLRATFYDLDGTSSYIWNNSEGKDEILSENKAYIVKVKFSEADGEQIYDYENYPTFPIVPMWANDEKQSELTGLRDCIDCYDLIKSGFADDVDDASLIYWTIQNAGGMDDLDLREFVDKLKRVHAAQLGDGQQAESHAVEVPFQSRESILNRIRVDLYRDAMALDIEQISAGNITATQIKAAYEALDQKCNNFEFCILDFLDNLMAIVGLEKYDISFTRSKIANVQESVQTVLSAAQYTSEEYTTRKVLELLGDGDMLEDVLNQQDEDSMNRFNGEEEDIDEEEMDDEDDFDVDAQIEALMKELEG